MSPTIPTAPAGATAYYPALTGLRAVAAYLVFFLHFRPLAWHEGWVDLVCRQFYLGVSMFFVLSGFVIAHRYQGSVQLSRGWWRAYFWRRAARIYPAYLLLNTSVLARIYWPLPAGKVGNSLLLVFLSESMLRGFSSTLKYVGLPQGWSLTPEECFYFSVPVLLVLWGRRGWQGAVGFVAAVFSFGLLLTCLCQGRPALHGFFGSYYHLFNFTFFGRVLEFTLGVGLARWWRARPTCAAATWPWRTLAGALGMALLVGALATINSPQPAYEGNLYPSAIVLSIVAFPLAMALLLAGLLAEASWLRRWLATPLLQMLGRSSYFFYLFHVGLFSIWWRGAFGWSRHVGWQFVATIILAELGYRFFERPVHRWLLARTNRAPRQTSLA
ncbi:acyltransferase [Hymenobacter sp. H14-R3]|uniref:acyltransferase family protein n=1 Tax=Hymenobacter sp. H14-R3 TaxID=3046308 RepID=UPI0024BA4405|nr:acyltransferase [Hymenobacter sp. H14-R3]MDJ0364223.1 acyltransferase [Hymenobacter sp. H14-R3]